MPVRLAATIKGIKAPVPGATATAPVCTEHVYLLHNSSGEVVFVFARGKMSRVVAPSQEMRLQAPFAVSVMSTHAQLHVRYGINIHTCACCARTQPAPLNLTVSKARDTHLAPGKVDGSNSPDF
ncbi:hypothetical protein CFAM422_008066 [Trichoderma lentiforme]|uniref:Uncharacterized protein n=1 Tax=Trichoderma lentiforme TaxID=1567552 RepID=A0A9P5CCW7_9HYPO|nr:hypothetical protein CFAM422_008066 [Trichoderma lentiforme]